LTKFQLYLYKFAINYNIYILLKSTYMELHTTLCIILHFQTVRFQWK